MMKITVFTVASISITFVILGLMYWWIDSQKTWVFWLVTLFAFVAGLLVGYVAVKFEKFGVALVGGAAGFALGLVITNTF